MIQQMRSGIELPQSRKADFTYGRWNVGMPTSSRVMLRCGYCKEQIQFGEEIIQLFPTITKGDRAFPFPRIHINCRDNYIRLLRAGGQDVRH